MSDPSLSRRERWALESLRSIKGGRAFEKVFSEIIDAARDELRPPAERLVWSAIENAVALDLEKK